MSAVFASNNDASPAAPSIQPRSLDNDCESLASVRAFGGWKTAATRSAGVIDCGRANGAGAMTLLVAITCLLTRTTGFAGLGGRRLRAVPAATERPRERQIGVDLFAAAYPAVHPCRKASVRPSTGLRLADCSSTPRQRFRRSQRSPMRPQPPTRSDELSACFLRILVADWNESSLMDQNSDPTIAASATPAGSASRRRQRDEAEREPASCRLALLFVKIHRRGGLARRARTCGLLKSGRVRCGGIRRYLAIGRRVQRLEHSRRHYHFLQ